MTNEDGTHSGFRNVVDKFTSHTVQKPQNQKKKTTLISRWKSDSFVLLPMVNIPL
jgi:hypothetical protein